MTHENDIPEFALQPAREPKTAAAEAVYHTEKIVYPAEEQTAIYEFEEDILVPDTKADMSEILLMDACCDIIPSEKKVSPKTDDLLNITGIITIQTIYDAEGGDGEPVSITSKVPYKYQWSLNPMDQADGVFDCSVKKLDYMIINERKFRVKITLQFTGKLFCESQFKFFTGLADEDLERKKETAEITCLKLVKKDEVSIDETFNCKDSSMNPQYILKQDFVITENYRQITTEKVVINGFIFCSMLYAASGKSDGEAEGQTVMCQHNERIEFTQFVPIEKEHRGKNWSCVRTFWSSRNLAAVIEYDEEDRENIRFRIKGDVQVRVELYESRQKDMITDAYHLRKNFECDFAERRLANIAESAVSETSVREIVNLPEGFKASEAVYCSAKVLECQCVCERGKVVVTGMVSCCALWKDKDGCFRTEKVVPDFRGSVDMEKTAPGQKALCRAAVKSAWVEIINEKQIEVNCSVMLCVETMDDCRIALLENPRFSDKTRDKEYPMVIATVQDGENLWQLAKKYKTTENHIKIANKLENEPEKGRKLLIIK